MAKFCFTGSPFVDAGIAGMCAAANIGQLDQLDAKSVVHAVEELIRLIGTEHAFKKRADDKAFATSDLSVIFPNGPFSNPAVKGQEKKIEMYKARLRKKRDAFQAMADAQASDADLGTCFVDGSAAVLRVGNDEFPLVDSKSKRNFHPGLQEGHAIGALTALALEFFLLSVLRTGVNSGLFWFVHTANEEIAIACARLTYEAMNKSLARNEGLGFFGDWNIGSRDGSAALVALIRRLMMGDGQTTLSWNKLEESGFPVMGYVFSNDNRGATIAAHDLPHVLFRFFNELRYSNDGGRFQWEVMQKKSFWLVAGLMLERKPIVSRCSLPPKLDGQSGLLLGGWRAHSLYAAEVLDMSGAWIRDIETVSGRISESEDVRNLLLMLRQNSVSHTLDRLCSKHLMTFDELARLAPPDERGAAFTVRDYLLAAVYERIAQSDNFLPWPGEAQPDTSGRHPLILLVEQVGAKLAADADAGAKMVTTLAYARNVTGIRGALLRVVAKGVLTWTEFVKLCPPPDEGANWQTFLLRDYLLAYLYTALQLPDLPAPALPAEKDADIFVNV